MIYPIISIRDKYTTFMAPTVDQTVESAKRNFAFAINNNPGLMNFSPSDYDLYQIGNFDSVSGVVEACEPIQFICNGNEVFNEKSKS